MTSDVWRRRSPLVFLFVTVFVDMIGYGIVVPLLPFYAGPYASGAVLVGLLGSLYATMQFAGGPFVRTTASSRSEWLLIQRSGYELRITPLLQGWGNRGQSRWKRPRWFWGQRFAPQIS